MDQFNPYESPQVDLSLNSPKQTDRDMIGSILGPDWLEVCKGAQCCMSAIKIGLIAAFLELLRQLLAVDLPLAALNTLFLISLIVSLFAIVTQRIGIQKLHSVSLETRARSYFTIAMFAQCFFWSALLLFATSLLANQFGYLFNELSNGILVLGILIIILSGAIYYGSLFLGLRQIGLILKNNTISNCAIAAMIALGLILLRGTINIFIDDPDPSDTQFLRARLRVLADYRIFIFAGYFFMLAVYATALTKIAKYANQYKFRKKEENIKQFFENISAPPTSEE